MRAITILLSSRSPIIASGMEAILRSFHRHNLIIERVAPSLIVETLEKQVPSLLFIDVADALSLNIIETVSAKTTVVGLTHSLLSREIKRQFRYLVSVYSTPEDIESIITDVYQTESKDSERMELTPREKEVVKGIVMGLSNKEIAARINVSVNTVMTHRRNIASKLQIHSSAGLTIYAIVSKLVDIDEVKDSVY